MRKSELMTRLAARRTQLNLKEAEMVVDVLLATLMESLAAGKRIEVRGFGNFDVRHRAARLGRNPRSGDSVHVAAKRVPVFKAGRDLRENANRSRTAKD